MCLFVRRQTGRLFDEEVAGAFLRAFPPARMASLAPEQLVPQLKAVLPDVFVDYSTKQLVELGGILAQVTDYKSTFTSDHSRGVARRVRMLAEYEGIRGCLPVPLRILVHQDLEQALVQGLESCGCGCAFWG